MTDINKACADYLEAQEEVARIMLGLKKKYQSLGQVGGVFVLHKPTDAERKFLRGLFRTDYSECAQIGISMKRFEKAFQEGLYAGMALEEVLAIYFRAPLVSNKVRREAELARRKRCYKEAISASRHISLKSWFQDILDKKTTIGEKWINDNLKTDSSVFKKNLSWLNELISLTAKEETGILIQVAAAKITKNPHALDTDTPLQKFLIYYLCYHHDMPLPSSQLDVQLLLEMGNLLVDSGSRTVMTYGFEAYDADGHPLGWSEFYHRREPLVLTMMNLAKVEKLLPIRRAGDGAYDLNEEYIYCFENPAVFNTFLKRRPDLSLLCVSGQINTAVYKYLDLLVSGNKTVFYHGDFDPEGLLIAEKLLNRYSFVRLFGYEEACYLEALSDEKITERRLKQLDQLQTKELQGMKELLKKYKMAGYEEYIIEKLLLSCRV